MATAGDIREIMEIPQEGPPKPAPKKVRAEPGPRLTGFQREVQSLMSDSHNVPPIPIVDNTRYKAKPTYAPRAFKTRKWEERGFVNGARTDGLELWHWKHAVPPPAGQRMLGNSSNGLNVVPDGNGLMKSDTATSNGENFEGQAAAPLRYDDEFPMEKFNVKATVPTYTSEQYAKHFKSQDWTKEETDYLMNLCRDFDLRWIVIADRYDESDIPTMAEEIAAVSSKDEDIGQTNGDAFGDAMVIDQRPGNDSHPIPEDKSSSTIGSTKIRYPQRTLESLKSRYYTIASKMLSINTPPDTMTPSEFALWEKMKNFDARTEELRKNLAEKLFMRTKEEADEERILLEELARITKNEEEFLKMRKDLYQRLETPVLSRRAEDQGTAAVYQTSSGLGALLSNLLNRDKRFKRPGMIDTSRANSGQDANGEAERGTAGTATDRPRKQTWEKGQHPNQYTARRNTMDAESANGDAPKKTGPIAQTPNVRTLSPAEEAKYGVAHPSERITSGVQFRHEKASKVVLSKSAAQMAKIQAALVELGIPVRLLMPTEKVSREYERLVADIVLLLDARRAVEKVGSEVKVLEESKRQRLGLPKGNEEEENAAEKMDVDRDGDTAQEGLEESQSTGDDKANARADSEGDADKIANEAVAVENSEGEDEARVEAGARKEGSALDAEEVEENNETGENDERVEAEEDVNAEEDKHGKESDDDNGNDDDEDAADTEAEAEAAAQEENDDEEDELAASPESEDEASPEENDDDDDDDDDEDDAEQDVETTHHRAADVSEEVPEEEAEPEEKAQPAAVPARLHKRSASVISDGSRAGSNRSGVSRKKGRR